MTNRIYSLAENSKADVLITEVGGTTGDIDGFVQFSLCQLGNGALNLLDGAVDLPEGVMVRLQARLGAGGTPDLVARVK